MLRTHPGPPHAASSVGESAKSAGARGPRRVVETCEGKSQQLQSSLFSGTEKLATRAVGSLSATRTAIVISVVLHGAAVAALITGFGGLGKLTRDRGHNQASRSERAAPARWVIEQSIALAQPEDAQPKTPEGGLTEREANSLPTPKPQDPLTLEEARDDADSSFFEDDTQTSTWDLLAPADRPFTGQVPGPGQILNPHSKAPVVPSKVQPAPRPTMLRPTPTQSGASPPKAAPPATPANNATATISKPRAKPGHNPKPRIPRSAARRGLKGRVILRVTVSETGNPLSITVAHSSGHKSLDNAAQQAVSHWKFIPGLRNAKPQVADVHLEFNFQ